MIEVIGYTAMVHYQEYQQLSLMLFESNRGHSWCVSCRLISFVFSCIVFICDFVEPACAAQLCQPGYSFMRFVMWVLLV